MIDMKRITKLLLAVLTLALGCQEGYIDDIKPVQAGADTAAPAITMTYPLEGTLIRVREDVTSMNVRFTVSDDIEIAKVVVQLNGEQIAAFDDFLDYRKAVKSFVYDKVTTAEHTLTVTATDIAGKSTTQSVKFEKVEPYQPVYEGEIFYMPFDGENIELVSITNPTIVGNPGFSNSGKKGSAYAGANDAYLTFPSAGLTNPGFSASLWYKVNATPDRAGILTLGSTDKSRNKGFRFFREGSATNQTFKLNVGNGAAETWVDGGAAASINPTTTTGWVHLAFTISGTRAAVYINGQLVRESTYTSMSWADTEILSIGSGAPNFVEWNHLSDRSQIDELRIFDKALTEAEVKTIFEDN